MSPWKDTAAIAIHLGFVTPDGRIERRRAQEFLDRHHVPTKWRGREVVAQLEDVDAALRTRTDRPNIGLRRVS